MDETGEPTLSDMIAEWDYAQEAGVLSWDEEHDLAVSIVEAARELIA